MYLFISGVKIAKKIVILFGRKHDIISATSASCARA